MSSTKFVFFWLMVKPRWPPWPLIGWHIFDFSSKTAERNSTKLDRKLYHDVLYQAWVFLGRLENQMAIPASDCLKYFIFSTSLTPLKRIQLYKSHVLDRKQDHNVLYQFHVLQAKRKTKMAAPASDWPRHNVFSTESETTEQNSMKLDRKHYLNIFYQVLCFRVDWKSEIAALADLSTKVAHCTQVHNMWPFVIHINWSALQWI